MNSSNGEFGVSWVFRKSCSVLWQNCGRLIFLAILLNVTIWQFLEDFPDYVRDRFPWESGALSKNWGDSYLPQIEETVFSVVMTATFTYVVYVYLTRGNKTRLQDQVVHVKSLDFASTVWRTFVATFVINVISILFVFLSFGSILLALMYVKKIGALATILVVVGVQVFIVFFVFVLMSRCLLIIPAVVGGRLNIRHSFRESWDLTSKYRLQIWLIYTLFSLALAVLNVPLLAVLIPPDLNVPSQISQLMDVVEKLRPFSRILRITYAVIYAALSSVLATVCYVHLRAVSART